MTAPESVPILLTAVRVDQDHARYMDGSTIPTAREVRIDVEVLRQSDEKTDALTRMLRSGRALVITYAEAQP